MKPAFMRAALVSAATMLTGAMALAQQDWKIALTPTPVWESSEEMHDFYIARFESAYGFGLSRMPQPPMLDRSGVLDFGRTRYSIERLELMSLLKHETPVVYVPVRHNLKFNPADFKNRELTPFETRALALLRAGRGLEMAEGSEPGTLEVVGALRGEPSCLKCHKDKREGELLGAFTYTLKRR